MYWVMANERSDENELSIDGIPPMIEKNDWNFDSGEIIHIPLPVIEIPYTIEACERKTDNLIAHGCRGLLVHKKIRAALDNIETSNVDYYKTKLINRNNGNVDNEYYIANVIGLIDCIDHEKSKLVIDEDDGDIEFIDKMVLKDPGNEGYPDIFRISEFLPIIIVSDSVKMALKSFSGFIFYKPEDYSL